MESTATPSLPTTDTSDASKRGPAKADGRSAKKSDRKAAKQAAKRGGGTSGQIVAARSATQVRRSRVEMSRVDLWSALKVSLCFYLAGLALIIVAGVVAWLLLDSAGQLQNVENFMGDIVSAKDYHFVASQILLGSVLVGLVLVALMTILTVVAAALYNVFSELVGGVEVTLTESD